MPGQTGSIVCPGNRVALKKGATTVRPVQHCRAMNNRSYTVVENITLIIARSNSMAGG